MKSFALMLLLGSALSAVEPFDLHAPEIKLWLHGAPGSEGVTATEEWIDRGDGFHRVRNIHNPSLTVFLPPRSKANGAAFIVCPGGGHNYLVMDLEGASVAKRLNRMGVAAFILKSRLAHTEGFHYRVDVESLGDAQRAIRVVRSRASEWGLDPARVGIMGFSAGGEIGALVSTRFDAGNAGAADPVERLGSRPAVAVLGYPAIRNITTIPEDTPPTFLVVNNDDNLAPASAEHYLALRQAGVSVELLIFNRGGHGFGMTGRDAQFEHLPVSTWPDRLEDWLRDQGFLTPKQR